VTALCPEHGSPLVGGPTLYTCEIGRGHTAPAADLVREVSATNLVRLPASGSDRREAA
jgi:hypothetical protein